MRLNALIFWGFSASNCSYFVLNFYGTFLLVNDEKYHWLLEHIQLHNEIFGGLKVILLQENFEKKY